MTNELVTDITEMKFIITLNKLSLSFQGLSMF